MTSEYYRVEIQSDFVYCNSICRPSSLWKCSIVTIMNVTVYVQQTQVESLNTIVFKLVILLATVQFICHSPSELGLPVLSTIPYAHINLN